MSNKHLIKSAHIYFLAVLVACGLWAIAGKAGAANSGQNSNQNSNSPTNDNRAQNRSANKSANRYTGATGAPAGIGSFSAKDRDEIKAAFKLLYTSGLNISQALEKAASMKLGAPAREFFDFVAAAKEKRGVCPFKRGADGL